MGWSRCKDVRLPHPKKISEGSFRGKRSIGRPRSWCEDNVQKDSERERERERDALDFSLILRAGDVPRELLPSVVIRLISAFLSSSHLKRYRTVFLVIIIDVKNMQQPYHNASTVRLPAAGCN